MSRLWVLGLVVAAIVAVPMLVSYAAEGEKAPPPPRGERKGFAKGEGRPEAPPPLTDEQKAALEAPTQAFLAALKTFRDAAVETLGPQGGRMYVQRTIGQTMREGAPGRAEGEKGTRAPKGERKGKKAAGDTGGE